MRPRGFPPASSRGRARARNAAAAASARRRASCPRIRELPRARADGASEPRYRAAPFRGINFGAAPPKNGQMPAALRFVLLLVLIALMSAALAVRERPAHASAPPPAVA